MQERINVLIQGDAGIKVYAGTFHSLFAKFLRHHAELLGFTPSFTIYDAEDQLSAVKSVMNLLNISTQDYSPNMIRSMLSNAKNKVLSWQEVKDNATSRQEEVFAKIYQEYVVYLKRNNAMDFDDLLVNMLQLIKNNQEVLQYYRNRFKYILVDEYQDTNRVQYEVVNLLAGGTQNLCVVGDDAQSIYRWRGADIRNILDFKNDYPYCKIVRLEQNYRSTKNIIGAADSVIKNNKNQIPKALWTHNPDGNKIEIIKAENEREEAELIISKIQQLVSKDYTPKDIAILYRTNAQSQPLEMAMRYRKLNYVIYGGTSFFKRKEVKDTISFLKLLVNSSDNESLLRIINEPPRGIGKTTLDHIIRYANRIGKTIYDTFLIADQISELNTRAIKAIENFTKLVTTHKEMLKENAISVTVISYIESTGILEMYKEIGTDDAQDRWNNIQQVISDVSTFFRANPELKLENYLEQISLISDLDEKDNKGEKITLMTVHSAKGLEFPIVFVAGLENGLFPLIRNDSPIEEEEEERRLFYVAITRAMEEVFITYTRQRTKFGSVQNQAASKFLYELNPEFIKNPLIKNSLSESISESKASNYFTPNNNYKQKSYYQQKPQINPQNKAIEYTFRVGEAVNHSTFGNGVITGLKGEGDARQAVVRFDKIGKKMLMLKYANLQKIK